MKTINDKCDDLFFASSGDMSKNEAKRKALELVEFAQRWIPVEEELPNVASDSENRWNNTHGFSLPVITKNDEFMPTYYKIQSYNVELKAWQTSEKVTHWRAIEF